MRTKVPTTTVGRASRPIMMPMIDTMRARTPVQHPEFLDHLTRISASFDYLGFPGHFTTSFEDWYYDSGYATLRLDVSAGGRNDGVAAGSRKDSSNHFELGHPLDSSDDDHDFSLGGDQVVGFLFQPLVDGTYQSVGIGGILPGTPSSTFTWEQYVVADCIVKSPVGGFVEPVDKLNVLAPYLALFGLTTIAIIALVPWKKPDKE